MNGRQDRFRLSPHDQVLHQLSIEYGGALADRVRYAEKRIDQLTDEEILSLRAEYLGMSVENVRFIDRAGSSNVPQLPEPPHRGNVITVAGTSSFSYGRTTVACNLAVALSRRGRSVAVFDMDYQFGDVAAFFGAQPDAFGVLDLSTADLAHIDMKTTFENPRKNLWIVPAPAEPLLADGVSNHRVIEAITVAASTFDYVVVDTSPVMDEPLPTLAALSGLLIVPDGMMGNWTVAPFWDLVIAPRPDLWLVVPNAFKSGERRHSMLQDLLPTWNELPQGRGFVPDDVHHPPSDPLALEVDRLAAAIDTRERSATTPMSHLIYADAVTQLATTPVQHHAPDQTLSKASAGQATAGTPQGETPGERETATQEPRTVRTCAALDCDEEVHPFRNYCWDHDSVHNPYHPYDSKRDKVLSYSILAATFIAIAVVGMWAVVFGLNWFTNQPSDCAPDATDWSWNGPSCLVSHEELATAASNARLATSLIFESQLDTMLDRNFEDCMDLASTIASDPRGGSATARDYLDYCLIYGIRDEFADLADEMDAAVEAAGVEARENLYFDRTGKPYP